ncbi:copper-binding oxazolone/thioamide-containing RiPP [Methyloprofundus sp.]|uniref:HvfA family oxazolone/thioamide-modified RiPP metallophore n=1 Tax=Methyloprofundus sp. TaxID=2020875 RepID=UPI003D112462
MNTSTLIHSLGGAIAVSLLTPSIALASENPFAMKTVGNAVQLSEMSKGAEGKCGEGKCGDKKGAKASMEKSAEGKCGEGKCGDKKASNKKAMEKSSEGKCGEGKCGDKT